MLRFLTVLLTVLPCFIQKVHGQDMSGVLKNSKEFVVQIVAESNGYKEYGTGVFLEVKSRPIFITNYHVVFNADNVIAIPAIDPSTQIQLEAIKIWKDLDLVAFVATDLPTDLRIAMKPATISTTPPMEGQTIYSIGYPAGFGYTVNMGMITGLRVFEDLPEEIQGGRPLNPKSNWIETNLFVDARNSGGPLLNINNELIGINTFGLNSDSNEMVEGITFKRGQLYSFPSEGFLGGNDLYEDIVVSQLKISLSSTNSISEGSKGTPENIQLDPPANLNRGDGYLRILKPPPGALVHVDGIDYGYVPAEGGEVYLSGLPLEQICFVGFYKKNYTPEFFSFELEKHEAYLECDWEINLKQIPSGLARISIRTIPVDAQITISGPVQGTFDKAKSAMDFNSVVAGMYLISATRNGKTLSTKAEIIEGNSTIVSFNFLRDSVDENLQNNLKNYACVSETYRSEMRIDKFIKTFINQITYLKNTSGSVRLMVAGQSANKYTKPGILYADYLSVGKVTIRDKHNDIFVVMQSFNETAVDAYLYNVNSLNFNDIIDNRIETTPIKLYGVGSETTSFKISLVSSIIHLYQTSTTNRIANRIVPLRSLYFEGQSN